MFRSQIEPRSTLSRMLTGNSVCQSLIADGGFVVPTADEDLYSESESDWKEATLMTGMISFSARGMPPEFVHFELTMEDPGILSQIGLGRTEALALRRDEAARVVAPAPSKAFTWQREAQGSEVFWSCVGR